MGNEGEARVEIVDLGKISKIDPLIEALSAMQRGIIPSRKLDPILNDLSRHIYVPLSKKLEGVTHLIISPAGNLNRIPFELLKIDGNYLLEKHAVSYVGSGRDLVNFSKGARVKPNPTSESGPSIVVGNPKYDLDLESTKSEPSVSAAEQTPHLSEGSSSDRLNAQVDSLRLSDNIRAGFKPLPNTANEARTVYSLLEGKKALLLGEEARESRLWSLKSPPVLHIATHSYFTKREAGKTPKNVDLKKDLFSSGSSLDILQRLGSTRETVPRSPLESWGLALAGAGNQDVKGGGFYKEDGVLTGMEIAMLDLSNTDLVVVSSCKSSSGSIFFGEGSQSLSRAFRIAGAKTVIASQWPVSDKATSQLMSDFFKNRSSGKSSLESFRSAQLR